MRDVLGVHHWRGCVLQELVGTLRPSRTRLGPVWWSGSEYKVKETVLFTVQEWAPRPCHRYRAPLRRKRFQRDSVSTVIIIFKDGDKNKELSIVVPRRQEVRQNVSEDSATTHYHVLERLWSGNWPRPCTATTVQLRYTENTLALFTDIGTTESEPTFNDGLGLNSVPGECSYLAAPRWRKQERLGDRGVLVKDLLQG